MTHDMHRDDQQVGRRLHCALELKNVVFGELYDTNPRSCATLSKELYGTMQGVARYSPRRCTTQSRGCMTQCKELCNTRAA